MDGKLLSTLFLGLKEKDGIFGPIGSQNLFTCDNVVVNCSSSGKMNKPLTKQWIIESVIPSVDKKYLLMLDS
jgi:hypothetical protein